MWCVNVSSLSASISILSQSQQKPYKLKPYHCNYAKTETVPMKTLEEADVGIFCYISQLPGFRGVLKQRYADFIVNEVDSDGNVVHLTSLDAPPESSEEKERKICDQSNENYTSQIESFRSLVGDSDAESLKALIEQITPVVYYLSFKVFQAIHNFIKENFKFLVTDTLDGPDTASKCVRVRLNGGKPNRSSNSRKRKDRGDKAFDSRGSDDWPEHVGKFLRFYLYKENKDTQEALGLIAKMLGIQQRSFGFAGTKDKRSVSTQRVTVFKQHAKRLAALNERLIGIKVGDFCHVREGLLLGQLLGNRFTITLRGVVAESEETIKAAADALGRQGFINYFGLQRFGSGTVPTHLIGATLLRGEWQTAIQREAIAKAREYYKESGDIEGTLRQLPRHLVSERAILQCLKKCPGNYLQALKAIPRTLRMMYVHSYQSYLWNHAASMRVQKHGIDHVVPGDLVYSKGGSTERLIKAVITESRDNSCNETYDCSDLDEISGTALPQEKDNPVKAVNAEDILTGEYTIDDVVLPLPGSRVLYPMNDIAEVYHDLAKKRKTMMTGPNDDIGLGVPPRRRQTTRTVQDIGSNIDHLYCIGVPTILQAQMRLDSSKLCTTSLFLVQGPYTMPLEKFLQAVKEERAREFSITSMSGGYRRVFQKPRDFEWELLSYTDGNVSLSETDLDIIAKSRPVNEESFTNGNKPKALSVECEKQSDDLKNEIKPSSCDEEADDKGEVGLPEVKSLCSFDAQEPQMALKLGFTLPASCYATIAIRELLKTSTSVAFQKTLNH
ncbi:hypothetical protein HHK36_026765 [Tetracentron sinense]|uniref:TRUD domain-containing protein n=1 Tax=Tetracentron sinense TaxID=13715 RepID=A0A835D5S6_TETSI|nr:hypothetical protein HHK36_026765 [Tetracentron sinense]